MTLVNTLLPLFAVIAIGFAMVRLGQIDGAAVRPMGAVVIRVALPALVFLAVARMPLGQAVDVPFLLAYGAGSLATFAAMVAAARLVLGLGPVESAVVGLGAAMANSSFLGLPIAQALIGVDDAGLLLAHCVTVENLVVLPLALAMIARAQARTSQGGPVTGLLRNPLILALMAGLSVSATGLALPQVAEATLALIARLAAPLALLVIGGMLATLPAEGRIGPVALLVTGKLVLHPLAVLAAVTLVPGVGPVLATGGVLFAAMPMITIFPLLAAQAGQGQLGAFGLLAGTVAGFATVPAAIALLGLA
ncbi:MAG TPA: AEC family transporter [Paracoccaceae bacterium]|nr:AEC family transporter [Paracoccaceae bacterium]HMO71119.1 AEC family transporter [Paracoccaceae bacterium]